MMRIPGCIGEGAFEEMLPSNLQTSHKVGLLFIPVGKHVGSSETVWSALHVTAAASLVHEFPCKDIG